MITKRLLPYISENDIYRMYSPSKEGYLQFLMCLNFLNFYFIYSQLFLCMNRMYRSRIDEAIIGCSNYVEGQIMMLPKEVVCQKRIVICTLCACIRLVLVLNTFLKILL